MIRGRCLGHFGKDLIHLQVREEIQNRVSSSGFGDTFNTILGSFTADVFQKSEIR